MCVERSLRISLGVAKPHTHDTYLYGYKSKQVHGSMDSNMLSGHTTLGPRYGKVCSRHSFSFFSLSLSFGLVYFGVVPSTADTRRSTECKCTRRQPPPKAISRKLLQASNATRIDDDPVLASLSLLVLPLCYRGRHRGPEFSHSLDNATAGGGALSSNRERSKGKNEIGRPDRAKDDRK